MLRYDVLKNDLEDHLRTHPEDETDMPDIAHQLLQSAAVVRLRPEQAQAIARDPGPLLRDWHLLHPVFPFVHVEFDGGIVVDGKPIFGATIFAGEVLDDDPTSPENVPFQQAGLRYAIFGVVFGPSPNYEDGYLIWRLPPFSYNANGNLIDSLNEAAWNPLNGLVRNVLDFLALPSVRIEAEPGMAKINRSRKKKRKPPLTDYHIVRGSEASRPVESSVETGIKHRVRYDVRGNWATFTRGLLAGRRIWRRSHQRGPVDAPFRLKGYQR